MHDFDNHIINTVIKWTQYDEYCKGIIQNIMSS